MTGLPVMRPMFLEFPAEARLFATDSQWMVGDSLLVCPVTDEHVQHVDCYFPTTSTTTTHPQQWYDYHTLKPVVIPAAVVASGDKLRVEAKLDTVPVFIRGGEWVCVCSECRGSVYECRRSVYE